MDSDSELKSPLGFGALHHDQQSRAQLLFLIEMWKLQELVLFISACVIVREIVYNYGLVLTKMAIALINLDGHISRSLTQLLLVSVRIFSDPQLFSRTPYAHLDFLLRV